MVTPELTNGQTKAIKELRSRLKDEMSTELYENTLLFHRFLKARDYNINNAEHMLRNHLAWRKEFKVDTILRDYTPKEVLVKYFPGCYIGLDKDGSPVKYFNFGNLDPKGVRRSCKLLPDIAMHVIRFMEEDMAILDEQSRKAGKPLVGSVYILDLKNFPFAVATDKKTIEHAIYLAKLYQDHYPERLKTGYVINVSKYFALFYNIFKHFLATSILKKVTFYYTDEYKDVLRSIMDPDVLPAFLGGNKTDPDGNPLCLSFVNHSGVVPEKYFVRKNSRCSLAKQEGVLRLVVRRVSVAEVQLLVAEVGSVIEWEFETRSRDIGFGLFYRDGEAMVELVALVRLDTEDFSETGVHKCERTGTYMIVFDNSYSWLRSKEIYYRAVVKSPAEYEDALKDID